jgi:uncharacterized ion transporter superfamily protein YfcC
MRPFASKISFPSAYAVLMLVIVLGAALTWILPAGRYDLLRYGSSILKKGTFASRSQFPARITPLLQSRWA